MYRKLVLYLTFTLMHLSKISERNAADRVEINKSNKYEIARSNMMLEFDASIQRKVFTIFSNI